jgi:hypothetical protein
MPAIRENVELLCDTIDESTSEIRGVKLLGLTSKNGRRYLETALENAINLYEGAKVNVNHPKGKANSPRDYQDRLGRIKQVEHREGDGLYGTLVLNPKHPCAEQLLWDAKHAPENAGMSHNVFARGKTENKTMVIEAIEKVISIDLVADPATTEGLFESAAADGVPHHENDTPPVDPDTGTEPPATREALEAAHPEIFAALRTELTEAVTRKITVDVAAAVKTLMAAQLPYNAMDSGWLDAIVVADEATRERMITDRKSLIESIRAKLTEEKPETESQIRPRSKHRTESVVTKDAKEFATALYG